jgi:hypothetical protein
VILEEAAQRVGGVRREEPERLAEERPPEASPGGLGVQKQGQEVVQHQGQERGQQQGAQSGQHVLPRHHHHHHRPPPPLVVVPCCMEPAGRASASEREKYVCMYCFVCFAQCSRTGPSLLVSSLASPFSLSRTEGEGGELYSSRRQGKERERGKIRLPFVSFLLAAFFSLIYLIINLELVLQPIFSRDFYFSKRN